MYLKSGTQHLTSPTFIVQTDQTEWAGVEDHEHVQTGNGAHSLHEEKTHTASEVNAECFHTAFDAPA